MRYKKGKRGMIRIKWIREFSDFLKRLFFKNEVRGPAIYCKSCGSKEAVFWKSIKSKYSLNGRVIESVFSIRRCLHCNLKRVDPLLTQDMLLKLYDEDYYRQYLDNADARKGYFTDMLNTLGGLVRKGKILDVGCGDGLFLRLAREDGWDVYGIEPSGTAANLAKERHGVDIFNGLPEESGFKKGDFNAVTLFNVLGHMRDPAPCVGALKELLTGDGLLVIETPNFRNIWYRYRLLENKLLGIDDLHIPRMIYWFDLDSLSSMLNRFGFEIVGVKFINYGAKTPAPKPGVPFIKKAYLYYRSIVKASCNALSALCGSGDHIRVMCRRRG